MMSTGERIHECRIRNNLTLDDVAKYIGVGRQAVHKYEQGTVTNIPLDKLEKMAVLFGTSPEYLACWDGDSNISKEDDKALDELLDLLTKLSPKNRTLAKKILLNLIEDEG